MLTEEMVIRYQQLIEQNKQLEEEISELKREFHQFFNEQYGEEKKGEVKLGNYKIQRQIRKSETLLEDKTVEMLENLKLTDCILTVKKPDKEKIAAAVTLGAISTQSIEECLIRKTTQAIVVREIAK
ncbi:host-nuclease inhibitor Gam family protein [Metabacillus fastidiosus]|uniref:Host-nuclease inhibitor Gam family protein n=1 Tax=Metabacillus fastidiosus TaxID=1458 RepID=A0ABU6NXQ2_9BACI|nr:host-nuclease inhibitor Gam family protein [Metabacillus fastidiosus]MED4401907.1 host-nuclease inhibitor Gam family protein [Metabacillus fastidiosus]MED4454620.1 host-nuclease inhibitor Gam family protein [Metabacillus fastidiosus]